MSRDNESTSPVDHRVEARPQGLVHWITLDDPARLNVLNTPMLDALCDALERVAEDPDARVAVLTGAGERAFIGGADIAEMAALDPESARAFITTLHEACLALREAPVPVIARIEGYCLGGGLEIAASCDLRVAAEGARLDGGCRPGGHGNDATARAGARGAHFGRMAAS